MTVAAVRHSTLALLSLSGGNNKRMCSILLINPPVVKPSEPPAGIAKLCACLKGNDINCAVVDANIEGLLFLLNNQPSVTDTWSKRASKHLQYHLSELRSDKIYHNQGRYQRAIADINRLLNVSAQPFDVHLSLGNYQDNHHSPLNSADLLWSASNPEKNIFYPYFNLRLQQLIELHNPAHIGFSLNFLSQALTTFSMLGYIRRNYPEIKLLLGGGLITSWLCSSNWTTFANPLGPFTGLVDRIFTGPAECELLHYLNAKSTTKNHLPDYAQLPNGDYLAPGMILPYAASSGCYWNKCEFCPELAEGNRYAPITTKQVMSELRSLITKHKPKLVHLLDNAISPNLLTALAQEALEVPWYGFARVNEQLSDLDFCRALKKSGCVMLKLGIESGNQQVLDEMAKGVTVELTGRVLETLHQAGIATYIYLLFGTPSETEEKARHTLNFVRQYHQCITFLNLAIFNLPISSTVATTLKKHSFYAADLSLYTDFDHPLGWNRKEIRTFLDREFKRVPEIAQILRRDPPLFTSNHAALTLI